MEAIIQRAISPLSLRVKGRLTEPLSYGVYMLPANCGSKRRYRFGNYPIRMQELEREFGLCTLMYLFLSRIEAVAVASDFNEHKI